MQKIRFSKYLKLGIILFDIMVLVSLFWYVSESRTLLLQGQWKAWEEFVLYCVFLCGVWLAISAYTRLYDIARNLTYTLFLERIIVHSFLFSIGVMLLGKLRGQSLLETGGIMFTLSLMLLMVLEKSWVFFILKYIRRLGINHRNAMFLGSDSETLLILENTLRQRKDYGYRIFSYSHQMLNDVDKLADFWQDKGIHTVFLPMQNSQIDPEFRRQIFQKAHRTNVRITLVPEVDAFSFINYEMANVESIPILVTTQYPLEHFFNRLLKRLTDLILSIVVLVGLALWLFPIIALLIWIDDRGPIFFVQKRYGKNQKEFYCYKFRTMIINPDCSTSVTKHNDERITAFGRFLRKTSLDELPQFFNVLLGQMAVVGPRPHMIFVDDYYRDKIDWYDFRSMVKPGITGLAQVSGLRGDCGDMSIEMKKRILADSFYIKNWSLLLDIVIIAKTIKIIFIGDPKAR